MTTDQWVVVFSAVVSFLGFLLLVFQLRDGTALRKPESKTRVHSITRKLTPLCLQTSGFF